MSETPVALFFYARAARPVKGKTPDDSGPFFGYDGGGAALRKEVMPMVQFLLDVMAGFLASVLAALVLRHIFRD